MFLQVFVETHLSLQVTCQVTANTSETEFSLTSLSKGSWTRLRSVTLCFLKLVQLSGLQSDPVSEKKTYHWFTFISCELQSVSEKWKLIRSSTWRQCVISHHREQDGAQGGACGLKRSELLLLCTSPTDCCCLTAVTVQRNRRTTQKKWGLTRIYSLCLSDWSEIWDIIRYDSSAVGGMLNVCIIGTTEGLKSSLWSETQMFHWIIHRTHVFTIIAPCFISRCVSSRRVECVNKINKWKLSVVHPVELVHDPVCRLGSVTELLLFWM